jgi:hypothetical protein
VTVWTNVFSREADLVLLRLAVAPCGGGWGLVNRPTVVARFSVVKRRDAILSMWRRLHGGRRKLFPPIRKGANLRDSETR